MPPSASEQREPARRPALASRHVSTANETFCVVEMWKSSTSASGQTGLLGAISYRNADGAEADEVRGFMRTRGALSKSLTAATTNTSSTSSTQLNSDPEAGLSLVEVLVASMIFSIGVLGALGIFANARHASATASTRSQAALLLHAEVAEVRASTYDYVYFVEPANDKAASSTKTINGVAFVLTHSVQWQRLDSRSSAGFSVLSVSVAWTDLSGSHLIEAQTAIADVRSSTQVDS